jgi:hypothetical protein
VLPWSIFTCLHPGDAARVARTFRKLAAHDISGWAITGGLAIEFRIGQRGGAPMIRPLHDVDFLTDSFDAIPGTLGSDFLLRHVHPHDPPGKTLLQAVDPDTEVRVDVFRAYGAEMQRASGGVVSLEDLAARNARLSWDLMEGKSVAPKYARDFLRMAELVSTEEIEGIWKEHRKPHMPGTFAETSRELRRVIALRADLLIPPVYSTDVDEVCPRCVGSQMLPLATGEQIFSILGYC